MKAMIIGLGPEYNYPGNLSEWSKQNTRYASNHGASLISRTLAKQFDADYVDDFSDIKALRRKYDLCIIAFATHITTMRDVTIYADAIEKLDMKTVAFSLGVQDYSGSVNQVITLHPSIKRLLGLVSDRSNLMGVRGHYTASILYKHGFKNVAPIGCPTIFWGLQPELTIKKLEAFNKPLVVYHRTLAGANLSLMANVQILGQDFLDEAVFTDNLKDDSALQKSELANYQKQGNAEDALNLINKYGIFKNDFQTWFDFIKEHDFVVGPRLHGCIAALIQGIPAVLLTRDLRTREIAEMLNIPFVSYDKLGGTTIDQIYQRVDYTKFNNTYKLRYNNYLSLLEENELEHKLSPMGDDLEFKYSANDIRTSLQLLHADNTQISDGIRGIRETNKSASANSMHKVLSKYPVLKKILKFNI